MNIGNFAATNSEAMKFIYWCLDLRLCIDFYVSDFGYFLKIWTAIHKRIGIPLTFHPKFYFYLRSSIFEFWFLLALWVCCY